MSIPQQTAFLFFMIMMFIVAPICISPSIGGQGLNVPINIVVWTVTCWFVLYSVIVVLQRKHFHYDSIQLFMLLLIAVISCFFIFHSVDYLQDNLIFRYSALLAGVLFLIALKQHRLDNNSEHRLLYIMTISGLVLGSVTILQSVLADFFPNIIPHSFDKPNTGVFQQKNNNSTYLATTMLIAIYLMTKPKFRGAWSLKLVLMPITIVVCASVIWGSGSRAGLLGAAVGLTLMILSRRKFIDKSSVFLMLIALSAPLLWTGTNGVEGALNKSATSHSHSNVRKDIYTISWQLFKQKPILGHGVGSFQYLWTKQAQKYKEHHPELSAKVTDYTKHPHNELVYWAIECGVLVPVLMLFIVGMIIKQAFSLGHSRGLAYLALWTPISFHVLVELPFYTSSLHWILWLLIIALIFNHSSQKLRVNMSAAAIMLTKTICIIFSVLISAFLIDTYRAQIDLFKFMTGVSKPPHLHTALNNYYFYDLATEIAMRSKLHNGLENHNPYYVDEYLSWFSNLHMPVRMYLVGDLQRIYDSGLRENESCELLRKALAYYPEQTEINGC